MHYPSKVVKRRGFTALELIIVLVVGFSIIALSASKMGQLFSASSTAAAMGSVLDLYSASRSLRGPAGYGTDDLLVPLIKANMTPKNLAKTGDATAPGLQNEWGGGIKIKGAGLGFNLTYPNVPVDACVKMAQSLLNSGSFVSIKINEKPTSLDDSVATIVDNCAVATPAIMIFEFREGADAGT